MSPESENDESGRTQEPPPTREIQREEEADRNAPLVGETLGGRYRIEAHLGEGAMGAVYLAEHVRIGRQDAIKILNPDLADDEDAWARFTREARNASHINHPNVCTVYDFGETSEGLPYIAMEYVDGETLTKMMEREGPLPARRVLELAEQILDALNAAHSRGIVHRDLKPENIMLVRAEHGSGNVKVVDFGIAKAMQDDDGRQDITREGFAVGTPRYVAPEQVSGKEIDRRSDLYSLGIVLYEMLSGRLPFTGASWREVMTKRLSEDPVPLRESAPDRHLGEELERVIGRALSRDPEDRFDDAEAFRRALRQAIRSPGAGSGEATVPGTEYIDIEEHAPEEADEASVLDPSTWPAAWRRGVLAAALLLGVGGAGWFGMQAMGVGGGTDAAEGPADEAGEVTMADGETGGDAASPDAGNGGGGGQDGGPAAADAETGGGDGGRSDAAGSDGDGAGGGNDVTIREGGGGQAGSDQAGGEQPAGGGQTDQPAGGGGDTGAEAASPYAGWSASRVEDLLFDQLDQFGIDQSPSPAELRRIADVCQDVYETSGQPDDLRGLAAYLMARVRQEQGNAGEALRWAERAVDLDPDGPGFQTLLEGLRGGG